MRCPQCQQEKPPQAKFCLECATPLVRPCANWLVRAIGDPRGWDRGRRRDFQNDALIGLTARRHGATVVTANRADFELLAREIPLSLFPG